MGSWASSKTNNVFWEVSLPRIHLPVPPDGLSWKNIFRFIHYLTKIIWWSRMDVLSLSIVKPINIFYYE